MRENTGVERKKLKKLEEHYLLTNIKGIMIFLLVVYHFLSPSLNSSQFSVLETDSIAGNIFLSILSLLYMSAVPVFLLITGFGSKDTSSCRETAFGLYFVPYIVLMLIMALINAAFSGTVMLYPFEPLMQLWFLLAMFIWMLILKDVVSLKFAIPLTVIISLISGMTANYEHFQFTMRLDGFFAMSYVLAFLPFVIIGYKISSEMLSKICNAKRLNVIVALLVALAIPVGFGLLINFSDKYKLYSLVSLKCNEGYLTYFSNLSSYTECNLSGASFRLLFFVFILAFAVILLRFIPKKKIPFLTRIGNASLTIFSLHVFIVTPIIYFIKFDIMIMCIAAMPAAALICCLLSINKVNKTYMKMIFKISDAVKVKPKKAES